MDHRMPSAKLKPTGCGHCQSAPKPARNAERIFFAGQSPKPGDVGATNCRRCRRLTRPARTAFVLRVWRRRSLQSIGLIRPTRPTFLAGLKRECPEQNHGARAGRGCYRVKFRSVTESRRKSGRTTFAGRLRPFLPPAVAPCVPCRSNATADVHPGRRVPVPPQPPAETRR